MREIKFRSWDTKKMKMYYGDIRVFNSIAPFCNAPELFPIMQYTGLKDKNGVEIYEGDIISLKGKKGYIKIPRVVVWDISFSCWAFQFKTAKKELWKYKIFEVVGNIYENPELLEKSHERNDKDGRGFILQEGGVKDEIA